MELRHFNEDYWPDQERIPTRGNPTTPKRMVLLRKALEPLLAYSQLGGPRVLDAACSDGEFLEFLLSLGFRVVGIDLSAKKIRVAKSKHAEASLLVGTVGQLPFTDASFDAVWFGETLALLYDVHGALSEFNRILNRHGILILTTPYHGLIKNLAIVLFAFEKHFYPASYRIRFFNRTTLERTLRRAGFAPVSFRGVGRMWPMWSSFFVMARKEGPPGPPPSRYFPDC